MAKCDVCLRTDKPVFKIPKVNQTKTVKNFCCACEKDFLDLKYKLMGEMNRRMKETLRIHLRTQRSHCLKYGHKP